MNLQFKECKKCGTINEEEYKFCKNCGAPLSDNEYGTGSYTPPRGNGFTAPFFINKNYSQQEPELDGAPTEAVEQYVGFRSKDRIMNAFIAIKRGRKNLFVWSVLFFGLISAPLLSAWFFFRKCYKVGIIVALAVILLQAGLIALNYNTVYHNAPIVYNQIKNKSDEDLVNMLNSSDLAIDTDGFIYTNDLNEFIGTILQLSRYAGIVVLSLFGYYFYYKDSTSKVKKLQSLGMCDANTLSYKGGTSLALAIIVPVITSLICSFIIMLPIINAVGYNISMSQLFFMFTIFTITI